MDTRPYYQRSLPKPQDIRLFEFDRIDLTHQHLPTYPVPDPFGILPDLRPEANSLFDGRAAAAVVAGVGDPRSIRIEPDNARGDAKGALDPLALLESKIYADVARSILMPTAKCLAVMAYADYFPDAKDNELWRLMVSQAIMKASPGWCGTFGPDVSDHGDSTFEGNYDMTQMILLPLAYSYYDQLTPEAREKLITLLLGRGRIHRASIEGADDVFTSGGAPNDWCRAGYVSEAGVWLADIPETENHVLMIAATRYLTNQLLYQRFHSLIFDNLRNGDPSCTAQVLSLLRYQLRVVVGCRMVHSALSFRERHNDLHPSYRILSFARISRL